MSKNAVETDLTPIMAESRKLALSFKHGFINYDHLFLAMLKTKCFASKYLVDFDFTFWENEIKTRYDNTGDFKDSDALPLSMSAERMIKHSFKIARYINNAHAISTTHVLLAILSHNNDITTAFTKAGIVIEDITTSHFKKTIKSFPPILKPIRQRKYNKVEAFFIALNSKDKKLGDLHKNAWELYNYHQFDDSIKVCHAGLSLFPSDLFFRNMLCCNYNKQRDFESSLAIISQQVKGNPDDLDLNFSLLYIFTMMDNHTEAEIIVNKLLAAEPQSSNYLNYKGVNLSDQEKYSESIPFFEKSIENDPTNAYSWSNMGFAKYKLGNAEQGLHDIEKALTMDKGEPFTYRNKGLIYKEVGNAEFARQNLTLALKYGYTEKYGDEVVRLLAGLD
jgi:tetratricopeptide (TPR) repeat protein